MSMVNTAGEIGRLERLLQAKMLGLPLSNPARLVKQRMVLAWDGIRIYWAKSLSDPPPPTTTELEEAVQGLEADIAEAFARLYVPPAAVPPPSSPATP